MHQNLNTHELLVMGITLHGFFLAGLMAIGQLIANHKSTKNILFFGLFLDFTFFELHTLLYQAQILDHYILLNSLLVLAMYSLGPLFYLLVRFVLQDSFTLKAVHLSHFIPMGLAFISTMLALVYFPAKVMQIMPVMFTGFFAFFPSGLVLYWVTNTLLSIAQQWNINKVVHAEAKAKKGGKKKKPKADSKDDS